MQTIIYWANVHRDHIESSHCLSLDTTKPKMNDFALLDSHHYFLCLFFFATMKWIIFDTKTLLWLECQTCDFRHNISWTSSITTFMNKHFSFFFLSCTCRVLVVGVCLRDFVSFSHVIALFFIWKPLLYSPFANQNESIDSILNRPHEVQFKFKTTIRVVGGACQHKIRYYTRFSHSLTHSEFQKKRVYLNVCFFLVYLSQNKCSRLVFINLHYTPITLIFTFAIVKNCAQSVFLFLLLSFWFFHFHSFGICLVWFGFRKIIYICLCSSTLIYCYTKCKKNPNWKTKEKCNKTKSLMFHFFRYLNSVVCTFHFGCL